MGYKTYQLYDNDMFGGFNMSENYSLNYYRTNDIIEPITEEQEAFFFFSDNIKRHIRELQQLICDDAYGCYLVAGMRGSGKTSFINMVLSDVGSYSYHKEKIVVRLNAVQINDVKDLLLVLIDKLLYITENSEGSLKEFYPRLKKIDKLNRGNLKTGIKGKNVLDSSRGRSASVTSEIETGITIKSILRLPLKLISNIKGESELQTSNVMVTSIENDFEYVREEQPYEEFRQLLNDFESANYRLIIVLDELDKQEKTFMNEMFSYYKDFLTNYKLFCFFITDENTYRRSNQLRDNMYATYFIRKIYLPLMSYSETMRYCYGHYCEESKYNVDILYYMSLGNTRLINIMYKTYTEINLFAPEYIVLLYKARLFRFITDNIQYKFDVDDVKKLKDDMLKNDVKAFIEYIFDKNGCSILEASDYYNSIRTNSYPEAEEILQCMKQYKDDLELQCLNFNDEKIEVCYNDHHRVSQLCHSQIGIRDMFPFYKDGLSLHQGSCAPITLVKLGNNQPEAYKKALEHLIIANYFDIYKVILIKRERKEWIGDEEYSIMAIMNIGIGKSYAYYNEAGSYSDEGRHYAIDLLQKLTKLGVSCIEKQFPDGEEIDEILPYIIKDLE